MKNGAGTSKYKGPESQVCLEHSRDNQKANQGAGGDDRRGKGSETRPGTKWGPNHRVPWRPTSFSSKMVSH